MADAKPVTGDAKVSDRSAIMVLIMTSLLLLAPISRSPKLIWNLTLSAPPGPYLALPGRNVRVGQWVIISLPRRYSDFAVARHYIGAGVPLLKQVDAIAGDRVCASGPTIRVNGQLHAVRRKADGAGLALPFWSGCMTLRRQMVFLLNRQAPNSFDSRYFGPLAEAHVIAVVRPLWPTGRP